MKKVKVITHNSVNLDNSPLSFDVDMKSQYLVAASFKADIHLVGSNTAKSGIGLFCPRIPKEEASAS